MASSVRRALTSAAKARANNPSKTMTNPFLRTERLAR